MTAKGELIRSIIFFRRVDFKFQNQTYWYIGALAVISGLGMIYSLIVFFVRFIMAADRTNKEGFSQRGSWTA